MAVFSLAALLAVTALPGCTQNRTESVTEMDRTEQTEIRRSVAASQQTAEGRGADQTPGTDGDSVASSESRFAPGVMLMAGGEPIDIEIGHLVPCVTDWNSDGKKDLLVGQFRSGAIRLYLNRGTDAEPVFDEFSMLHAGGKPIRLDAG
jgi:hypothetical protein